MQINNEHSAFPLVSVIILTYRKFDDFYQTAHSVLMQDYPQIEVIVSDDGSPDFMHHEVQLRQYFDAHKRNNITRVIIRSLPKNVGTVKNANSAVALAQGKYIRFISPGDELLGADCIRTYVLFAQAHNALVVSARTLTVPSGFSGTAVPAESRMRDRWKARGGRQPLVVPTHKDIEKLANMTDARQRETLMTKCIISTPSIFYSREVFTEHGCFMEDYRLLEDMPTWPHLAQKGVRFYFLNKVMGRYALSGMSNGGDYHAEFLAEYVRVMKSVYIANDTRFGPFAPINRKLRNRYIDFLCAKLRSRGADKKTKMIVLFRYADCRVIYLLAGLKYLLFDTKL